MKKVISIAMMFAILFLFVPISSACNNSSKLEYILNEDGKSYSVSTKKIYLIPGYPGRESIIGKLVIPEKHDGLPITRIPSGAFSNHIKLTSVTIPSTVTEISNHAFSCCEKLQLIEGATGLTKIGDYAFEFCDLRDFNIPSGVSEIGAHAFSQNKNLALSVMWKNITSVGVKAFLDCKNITDVVISADVTHIGEAAFSGCKGLSSFVVDESNPYYSSVGDVLFNKEGSVLKNYPANKKNSSYTIPYTVLEVEKGAFSGNAFLTEAIISEKITKIAQNMFSNCTALQSVVIPDRLEFIDGYAFLGCAALTDITIPQSVTEIERSVFDGSGLFNRTKNNSVVYADKWVVGVKGKLSGEITLRSDTTGVAYFALYKTGMSFLGIPESVRYICSYAFYTCSNLRTVYIARPASLGITVFHSSVFDSAQNSGDNNIEKIYVADKESADAYKNEYKNSWAGLVYKIEVLLP